MSITDAPVRPAVAAKRHGVSTSTLRRWVAEGAPAITTAGGQYRFDLDSLSKWVEKRGKR